MNRKISAMVEAGILAAVAIVMALLSTYMPVLGMFLTFIWSLPIIICGMRNGIKWGIMCLLVSGAIISMVINPLHAVFLATIFGLLGVIIGECMRRHLPPMKLMLFASSGAVLSLIINVALSFIVLGINPVEMVFTTFDDSLMKAAEFYRESGMNEADIEKSVSGMKNMFSMMRVIMPAAFLVTAPILAFINYIAAKKVLTRLGEHFESFPPFTLMKVPGWFLWPYAISLVGVTWFYKYNQETWLYPFFVNVQTFFSFAFVLQGIVILYWFTDHYKKPRWWANIGTCLIFFVPVFSQIILYTGAFDVIFDFRKIRESRLFC